MPRILSLLLAILVLCPNAGAQGPGELEVDSSQLRFYLIQAFQAGSAADRLALNHIGIQVVPLADDYLVTAVLEGYPAHQAGINRGDLITAANGEAFHPVYSFNQASTDSSPFVPAHAQYDIELERNGDILSVQVTPVFENLYDSYRTATLNSIQQFSSGNKLIGYVRLWGFSRASNDLVSFHQLIDDFAYCDGLIIDLRNAYGFLDTSHLDLLMPNRRRFFTATGAGSEHVALAFGTQNTVEDSYQKPIAVLINADTRGGAELFAYQLAKLERVVTIGEATPGQIGDYRLISRGASTAFRYHPAHSIRIDGNVFETQGVTPQQAVAYPYQQSTRSDPQYETAVVIMLGII